jgi:hypothetical protein
VDFQSVQSAVASHLSDIRGEFLVLGQAISVVTIESWFSDRLAQKFVNFEAIIFRQTLERREAQINFPTDFDLLVIATRASCDWARPRPNKDQGPCCQASITGREPCRSRSVQEAFNLLLRDHLVAQRKRTGAVRAGSVDKP